MTTQAELQWPLALIRESNDAVALFSRGLGALRVMRHDYADAVVVMSLLALGAEKLLKLTIGLAGRDQGTGWPSKQDMQKKLGHQVLKADRIARPLLDMYPGTAPGWLDGLKRQVDADPALPAVLEALDKFGNSGRFYFLDLLASAPQQPESPQTLWTNMTTAIAASDSYLLADVTSPERYEQGRRRLNETVVAALTGWWELYAAGWRTGRIGREAQRYATEVALWQPNSAT